MIFLFLNKIRFVGLNWDNSLCWGAVGFIDYVVNLIEFDFCYGYIFVYVFGLMVVFDILVNVCKYLGKYWIVILDGEILESSGVMIGGSMFCFLGVLYFGIVDGRELMEIGEMEGYC